MTILVLRFIKHTVHVYLKCTLGITGSSKFISLLKPLKSVSGKKKYLNGLVSSFFTLLQYFPLRDKKSDSAYCSEDSFSCI